MTDVRNYIQSEVNTRVLSRLWKSRLDTLIGAIANNEQYYKEIANAAEHISAEYYGRFLIELIQNANDQAIRGSTTGCVTITRTKNLIAVGNVGEPFDDKKVDEITSIFLSSKSVNECVGNKGVGFKSVFQIADSAEIYSAHPNTTLAESLNLGFRIVRRPFDCDSFRHTVASIVTELLEEQPHRNDAIAERFDSDNVCETVLDEASRAAWFKFPLEADQDALSLRLKELGMNTAGIRECQTLIVLPIDGEKEETQQLAECAIDEIVGDSEHDPDSMSGASLLFLSGLDRLEIVDQVRGFHASMVRGQPEHGEECGEVEIQRLGITTTIKSLTDAVPRSDVTRHWWIAQSVVGVTSDEKLVLRDAITKLRLPPENWKDVATAPVAIALPLGAVPKENASVMLLAVDGRFSIGLPTKMSTGSPLWINAPFHGTIARTEIRLENPYNKLLFQKAVELIGTLASRFKRDVDLNTRRLATLMMRRGVGPVGDRLYESGGLAEGEIVLGEGGKFLCGSDVAMPAEHDMEMFKRLCHGIEDVREFGFVLPDRWLLSNARNVLDCLCPRCATTLPAYLTRGQAGRSLLESAAKLQRDSGAVFWEPFLDWVASQQWPDFEKLRDQTIIPVGVSSLEKASSRAFFRPFTSESTDEESVVESDSDDELELRELDETVAEHLKFFDENAVPVRLERSRKYTPIATKLASAGRTGLVSRPRLEDLLNQAVIPALNEASGDNDKSLRLLNQAILWLNQMEPKSLARVRTEALLVPGYDSSKRAWKWVAPTEAYLGEGWEDGKSNQLLSDLYGRRSGALLVPWTLFERKARSLFTTVVRSDWVNGMCKLGVWRCPRVVSLGRKLPVLSSYGYGPPLTVNDEVPAPEGFPLEVWKAYVQQLSKRKSYNKTVSGSRKFYLSDALWIDGLEDETRRPTVVEAMLRQAEDYLRHTTVSISRLHGEDPTNPPALWLYALQEMDWSVIPTARGLKASKDAWWIHSADRRKRRFHLLPGVPSEFSQSKSLLTKIGILTLDESSSAQLIRALHAIAAQLPECGQDELRYAAALATDVCELLDRRLKEDASRIGFAKILTAPVPLEHAGQIVARKLEDVDCIYVNDDAIRADHVDLPEDRYMIPSRFDKRYSSLIGSLASLLGEDKITRVSKQKMALRFEQVSKSERLIDFLQRQFVGKQIVEDIALLIAQGGGRPLDPRGQRFEQRWIRFRTTNVAFGSFEDGDIQACFDTTADGGPTLMVAQDSTRYDVVACSWQIVDKACEDTWILFAKALERGEADDFLKGKGISDRERIEIEGVIAMGFEQRLDQFASACYAIWKGKNEKSSFDEFQAAWKSKTKTPESASAWLGIPEIGALVDQASQIEEPEGSLLFLRNQGVSVSDWQAARQDLGEGHFVFDKSVERYEHAIAVLAARTKALVAHSAVPVASSKSGTPLDSTVLTKAKAWIEEIAGLPVPESVQHQVRVESEIISCAANDTLACESVTLLREQLSAVISAVEQVATNPPSNVSLIELKREPTRAAQIYQHESQDCRASRAASDAKTVLKVATSLATHLGEELDRPGIDAHPLVSALRDGWWANRVLVLAALRFALEVHAPKTASRMKEARAFRDIDDWQSLWRKFNELGDPPKPVTPAPPKRNLDLLGHSLTEDDFFREAGGGSDGLIAKAVDGSVISDFDLSALRGRSRTIVTPISRNGRRGRKGSPRTPSPRNENELTILGTIGERFVYQQFRAILSNFDAHNWLSKSREHFGYPTGNDSLGYDFEYFDTEGKLTGSSKELLCKIEVKSTTGDGTNPFEMSTNEWDVAYDCHNSDEAELYVIVRVANVATQPIVSDLLLDPVDLRQQGVLDYSSRNLLVVVGSTVASEPGA